MRVGVPKEIKIEEHRVSLTPSSVEELVRHGHDVLIEAGAGLGSGITDAQYEAAGASIAPSPGAIWSSSELVAKVKEPVGHERRRLSAGQVLFTYLHLAADPKLTSDLIASGATCIAYETVTAPHGGLPLLTPMSEVAGRLAPQVGAHCLERRQGGRGVLLGGVAGVPPADVLVLGGGTAGTHATTTALGMGASVTVVDRSAEALRRIVAQCGAGIRTIFSTRSAIEEIVKRADLVIGSVLVPGAATPKLLSRSMVKTMKPGAVIVDIAIDQGGCSETSRPTTHAEPTYVEDSVVHYCVANMPSAVARTSTFALNNVTLPFMLAIADKGWRRALAEDQHLLTGLSIHAGRLTSEAVAAAHDLPWTPPENALAI